MHLFKRSKMQPFYSFWKFSRTLHMAKFITCSLETYKSIKNPSPEFLLIFLGDFKNLLKHSLSNKYLDGSYNSLSQLPWKERQSKYRHQRAIGCMSDIKKYEIYCNWSWLKFHFIYSVYFSFFFNIISFLVIF